MLIGGKDFNVKLAKLPAKAFAKFYRECKWEVKTGVPAKEAHEMLKNDGVKLEETE